MTSSARSHELTLATSAVRLAAKATRSVQAEVLKDDGAQVSKSDRSPVTIADFAAQALIARALQQGDGNTPLVGEEDAAMLREPGQEHIRDRVVAEVNRVLEEAGQGGSASADTVLGWIDHGNGSANPDRFWTLDPIDGTKGFLRGGQYAIALALIENGKPVLGVLGCPAYPADADRPESLGSGLLLHAVAGEGATEAALDEGTGASQPIRAVEGNDPSATRFCESMESGHSDQDTSVQIAKDLGITSAPLRMDSQAKYAAVARGDAAIYLRLPTRKDYRERIWDHAAGMLVVLEAGGQVCDVDGKPLDFRQGSKLEANRGVIASAAGLHDAVVEVVGRYFQA